MKCLLDGRKSELLLVKLMLWCEYLCVIIMETSCCQCLTCQGTGTGKKCVRILKGVVM